MVSGKNHKLPVKETEQGDMIRPPTDSYSPKKTQIHHFRKRYMNVGLDFYSKCSTPAKICSRKRFHTHTNSLAFPYA